ncbi:MAG: hypothetical protein MUF38_00625 [Anaerolineae bacterium]|jgi:hypothetical protein|nr:hypothetical protein [Anaerolineae bacterium]
MSAPLTLAAPTPDLRIIPVARMLPHEEHDSQRSLPLMDSLRKAEYFLNPPIVAAIDPADPDTDYVILDGANRHYCFSALGWPDILVQVAGYGSPWLHLDVWGHVISGWQMATFMMQLRGIEALEVIDVPVDYPLARLAVPDGRTFSFHTTARGLHERNAVLREVVRLYQRQANLNRTAQHDPALVFPDYPDATGLMLFPPYQPHDIIEAAVQRAFLPPGISRHVIQGRAIRLNYPMAAVIEPGVPLAEKNVALRQWTQRRFANRQVRYYAEATYQFDE